MTTKRKPEEKGEEVEEERTNDAKKKKGEATLSSSLELPFPSSGILGEDLVLEVLRHVDVRTLARAACVSRLWRRTAEDERLWEGICTRHWKHMGCGVPQLRSVVLALGGFRRLHSLYLLPLIHQPTNSLHHSSSLLPIRPSSSSSSSSSSSPLVAAAASPPTPPPSTMGGQRKARWGKDEVNLSLSLLSIQHYRGKMGMGNRDGGWRSSS